MRDGKIVVLNNGKGMISDVFERAVCIVADISRYIDRSESANDHFGKGFINHAQRLRSIMKHILYRLARIENIMSD